MSKTLLVYYSYSGNTKQVADMIKKKRNIDCYELKAVVAYSDDYDAVVSLGHTEVQEQITPEIELLTISLHDYDTIILGSPIWWYTIAPVVRTFLSQYDVSGKKIYPLMTNGGYGLGHSIEDIRKLCPNSEMGTCLEVPFEENTIQCEEHDINTWCQTIEKERG